MRVSEKRERDEMLDREEVAGRCFAAERVAGDGWRCYGVLTIQMHAFVIGIPCFWNETMRKSSRRKDDAVANGLGSEIECADKESRSVARDSRGACLEDLVFGEEFLG